MCNGSFNRGDEPTKRILVGVFAATFLIAAPAYAHSIEDEVASQLVASGIDPATATQAQIDQALDVVLVAAIEAQLGGAAPTASPAQLAAAVSAILTNNPNLSTGTVAALTSAAANANPAAAADVAGAAVAARPGDAVQITRAAVAASPIDAAAIAASASTSAVAAGATDADLGAIVANAVEVANTQGVAVTTSDVSQTVATATGRPAANIEAAAVDAEIEEDEEVEVVEDVEDGDDENPAQDDATPA